MLDMKSSRVAEMVFNQHPGISLSRIVSELDQVLERSHGNERVLTWDCDDVAIFDMPGCRILVAYYEPLSALDTYNIVIGVGPSPMAAKSAKPIVFTALCDKIVARIDERCPSDDCHLREIKGVLTPELIDALIDDEGNGRWSEEPWQPTTRAGNVSGGDLALLRAALYPRREGEEIAAIANRMANQAIDLSASIVAMPGALASYILRRSGGYAHDPR